MSQDYRQYPKIAMFLPDLGIGGAERVFVTLSKQFVRMGLQVDLVLAEKSGSLLKEVDPAVNIVDLAARRPGEPRWCFGARALFGLTQYLRRSPPDTLLSTLSGANLTAILAQALSRRRFRLVIRESSTLANVKSLFRLRLMRLFYPLADNIIALTGFMKDTLVTSLGLSADKITVIGNPVDVKRVQELAADQEITRNTQAEGPFAVAVGRLAEPKDFAAVIRAVALVNRRKLLNLVIIGEGPQRNELQKLARTLGIRDRVHFPGFQSNPYPWLKQAVVFVLSSRWEGYPNVLLESMALGCPIVATRYDPSVQLILSTYPEKCYRVTGVGNMSEMADAIFELSSSGKVDGAMATDIMQLATNEYLTVLNVNH